MNIQQGTTFEKIFFSDQFPFIVAHIDKNRKILDINHVLPGFSKESVIGTSCDQYVLKENLSAHIKTINEALKTQQVQMLVVSGQGANKTQTWYKTHIIPVVEKGKSTGAYLISRDITDVIKITQSEKQKEIGLDIIFHQLPISIWMVDNKKIITSLMGPGLKDVAHNYIGKNVETILQNDNDKKKIIKAINKSLAGKPSIVERHTLGRYFQQFIEPFKNSDTKFHGAIGVSVEITEKKKAEQQLVESNERLKILSESAFEGIVFSRNGVIIDANEQFALIHGYKNVKEIIGKKLVEHFVVPSMQKTVKEYLQSKGAGQKIEIITTTKSGQHIFLECKGTNTKLRNENIRTIIVYDITKRKLGEKALEESERKLSTLMNSLPGMAYRCLCDEKWTVLFVSNGCEKLTGYKQSDLLLNKKIAYGDLVIPEDNLRISKEINVAIKKKKPFEIQYRIIDRKKNMKWVWERGEGIFDDKGRFLFLEGFVTDITERILQETIQKQNTELYQSLVEKSPHGTFIHDDKGKILYANPTTLKLIGIKSLASVKNQSLFDWVDKEFHKQITNDKNALANGKTVAFKMSKIKSKKGNIVDVEYRPMPFLYKGKPATLVVFHDVSAERKLNEERIRAEVAETSNIYLKKQIINRQKIEEKLLHSLKEKEVLLNEVHHRVKNNLQVISSILNLQSTYVTDPNTQDVLRESQSRIKSMAFIHESLYQTKDFSGIKFSDYIINLSNSLVHAYISTGEPVKLNLTIEDVFLNLDQAVPCGLILNELVSNALKYAFLNTTKRIINIGLRKIGNDVEIKVSDSGSGLPEDIDYRNTKTLGLQLVITLVDQLNGKIKLDNTKGASYTITFPSLK